MSGPAGGAARGGGHAPAQGSGRAVKFAGLHHPLMGASFGLLARSLVANRRVRPGRVPFALMALASAAARSPFAALDRLVLARRLRRAPAMEDPVFVVGHWRSGTTHLHNLLGCSTAFGTISPVAAGLPGELLTLGTWLRRWLERALPEDRHVDRVAVEPDSPQEDEIPLAGLQPLSIFHALYFPGRFHEHVRRGVFLDGCSEAEIGRWEKEARRFLAKVAVDRERPLLLVKNVAYTARIARLRRLWPDARFIHVRRNPYEVFVSSVRYFRHLLAELALQRWDDVDVERFVLDLYPRVMERFDADSRDLPPGRLAEVAYEDVVRRPIEVLADLHERLALPGWHAARPRVEAYLDSVAGYRTNRSVPTEVQVRKVDEAWGAYVRRWGYRAPAGVGAGG